MPGIFGHTDLSELNPAQLAVADPATQSYQTGRSISLPIRSVNGAAGQPLGFGAFDLPPGLRIDPATGVIGGVLPAAAGVYATRVTVAAAGAAPATDGFTWLVHGPVALRRPANRTGALGASVRFQVTAVDGLPGCTLRFAAGGLPPGVAIRACGLITGKPTRAGTYRAVIRVSDSSGATLASVSFRWTVA